MNRPKMIHARAILREVEDEIPHDAGNLYEYLARD